MSNYIQDTYHPETGELHSASWLDDYFGHHKYGVMFPDGKVFPADECRIPKQDDKQVTHPHLGPWKLLKTPAGTCPECAVDHDPSAPHNQQSLAYQYDFYGKHGRWPEWSDAMAHCTDEVKQLWIKALAEKGVTV